MTLPTATTPARQGTAWLADDSATARQLAMRSLADTCRVRCFASAPELLEALELERPDVLVLDVHMPDVSGLEVCRFVRQRANESQLPILVLTGSVDHESLIEAFGAGANDFVRKPFDDAELRARVATLVRTKQLHDDLVDAEARLQLEAQRRERLIAMLAHDLRQPVHLVTMALPSLEKGDLPAPVRAKIAGRVGGAVALMSRMITDLLDLARSQNDGAFPLSPAPAELVEIARRVVDEVRTARPARSIDFHALAEERGTWDVDRIAQIVSNLVENALHHGPPDGVVTVAISGDADAATLVVTNPGEITADRDEVFRAFGRSAPHARHGLGLGLYIVEQIVVAHAGTVTFESSDGVVRFVVRLPRSRRA